MCPPPPPLSPMRGRNPSVTSASEPHPQFLFVTSPLSQTAESVRPSAVVRQSFFFFSPSHTFRQPATLVLLTTEFEILAWTSRAGAGLAPSADGSTAGMGLESASKCSSFHPPPLHVRLFTFIPPPLSPPTLLFFPLHPSVHFLQRLHF